MAKQSVALKRIISDNYNRFHVLENMVVIPQKVSCELGRLYPA